jgi:hypothetical protein
MEDYTVIGFWPDTMQRFATTISATSADDAEMRCSQKQHGVMVCGVIKGKHECLESTQAVASELC